MRIPQINALALTLGPLLAQSPQPKGTVTATGGFDVSWTAIRVARTAERELE